MFFQRRSKRQAELDPNRIPRHIGIIMDGNGRWAKKRGLPRKMGHKKGAETLEIISDYCDSIGVKAITVYAFSTENWARPKDEVDALMELLYNYLITVEKRFENRNMSLKISGDTSVLSEKIQKAIVHAEEVTASGTGLVLNIALNYGGRAEILHAARLVAVDLKHGKISEDDITEEYLNSYMYTAALPEVDLIIRPSGEYRLSNFLLWQAAYAEFWFSSICWPDFTEDDMKTAILDFQNRDRRFGGVK
ncbi:MAG: isoprenyl transferase [Oscillospiraceae bacterium]